LDDIREIKEIWRGEIGRALKGGRVIVLLILFLLFTGLALTIVGSINHQLNAQVDQAVAAGQIDAAAAAKQAVEGRKKFLSALITDDELLLDWLSSMPLVLFVVFKLTMIFAPLFIALMSFDQISGEIGPKSIRYLVVRVKRSSILIGKFLAQATLASGLLVLCTVMMVAVAKILNADFTLGSALLIGLKLSGVLVVFALAYLGLSSLCSAVTRQSGVSLVLNVILLFIIWSMSFIGGLFRLPGEEAAFGSLATLKSESWLGYMRYGSVWNFGQDLLHPEPARFLSAGMVHLGFALFFLGLAHLALRRRDL
jgi:ABC-type transport system involved in multi-copper enzyme maturation permease subunit